MMYRRHRYDAKKGAHVKGWGWTPVFVFMILIALWFAIFYIGAQLAQWVASWL